MIMIVCPKCGRELPDGTKFCKYCGSSVAQTSTTFSPQNLAHNQQPPIKPSTNKSGKGIFIIIALLLVIAIALGGIIIPKIKNKSIEDKFTEILEESTAKPLVEMMCMDYDRNGTLEAYAIMGESDDNNRELREFYDADIFFVNETGAEIIKESVRGKTNGTINIDEITYISIEIYDDTTGKGKSFIYTADGNDSAESALSGKHSGVHEEDGKIIGFDDNGNEIDLFVNISVETTDEFSSTSYETSSKAKETTTKPATTKAQTTLHTFDTSVYNQALDTYRAIIKDYSLIENHIDYYMDPTMINAATSHGDGFKYSYTDLNGDNIPELIVAAAISKESGDRFTIDNYTISNIWEYENGKVEKLLDDSAFGYRAYVIPCQNGILKTYQYPGGGQNIYQFHKISDASSEPVVIESAESFDDWVDSTNTRYAHFDGEIIYNENDVPASNFISESEYNAVLNKYIPLSGLTWYNL